MYQKFIITHEGVLRFGNVYQHRELLRWDEDCPYVADCGRLMKGAEPCFSMDARLLSGLLASSR